MITPERAVERLEQNVKERQGRVARLEKHCGPLPIEDRTNQICLLFEGICPTCGNDTDVIRVGGRSRFRQDYGEDFDREAEIVPWQERDFYWYGERGKFVCEPSDEGEIDFVCTKGHEHCVGHAYGDWN